MTRVADSKLIAAIVKMLLKFYVIEIFVQMNQIKVMYVGRSQLIPFRFSGLYI
jgi:hypothetical protein